LVTSERPRLTPPSAPKLGERVLYVPSGSPVRGAFVMHVHADGETVDLVVVGEGDPRQALTREAWAHGQGVVRARLDLPHWSRANGPGCLAWAFPEEFQA